MACDEKEVKRESQLSVVGPCEADSKQARIGRPRRLKPDLEEAVPANEHVLSPDTVEVCAR